VAAVIGEGGSGGALAMAIADRVLILENAIYSVASPEACASITWRDSSFRREAAAQLRLTSDALLRAGIIDEVVPEPDGAAHADHDRAALLLDEVLHRHLQAVQNQGHELMLRHRHERFRRIDHRLELAADVG
jgi:acetyl-CoA carboxylase carboxyl transferase subunit alpha